ncbi:hypothetical protein ABZ929_11745 [Streptomyces physcomitrii]|uniref:hypothetical protein n=1 Tax=Streptomyces physcomitrii TaxID=2724184 RepID=UPI0033DE5DCD
MIEYNYAAQDPMCMRDGRRPEVLMKRDGDVQRFFDPESGEFGSAGPRGIITYFTPDDAWTSSGGSQESRFHK